ncbi:hypothetical protein K438DRAFT_1991690 [Mycena galopus ATCC 62051]|nr:hypothetical protein K438DRAFT_1991690 [Mycena galopus ATCC 62051]
MPRNDGTTRMFLSLFVAIAQSTCALTALFAITSSQLMGIIQADRTLNTASQSVVNLLVFSSYAALLFNTLALGSSQLVLARLAAVTLDIDEGGQGTNNQHFTSALEVLCRNGAGKHFKWLLLQWLTYLFLGVSFALTQSICYVWLSEGLVMAAIVPLVLVPAAVLLVASCHCHCQ